jgi:hypothetical protein
MATPQLQDFSGIWLMQSRSPLLSGENTLILLDTQASTISWYPGDINYVRDYQPFDFAYTLLDTAVNVPVNLVLQGRTLLLSSSNLNFFDPTIQLELTLEDCNQILRIGNVYLGPYPYVDKPFLPVVYFKRQKELPPSFVQYTQRPQEVDWNRLDLLLKFWIDNFLLSYNNIPVSENPYFDLERFKKFSQAFLCGPSQKVKANVEWIYKSQEGAPLSYQPTIFLGNPFVTAPRVTYYATTLFLEGYHPISRADRVTIHGLKGEWSVLNGDWDIDPVVFANSVDYPEKRVASCSTRRYITLPFDSRALPNYNPKCHGQAHVKAIHKPVTESNYRDFAVALDFLGGHEGGFSTHTRGYFIALLDSPNAPPRVPESYQEIQQLLNTNPSFVVSIRWRSRTYPIDNAAFYHGAFRGYSTSTLGVPSFDWNNPYALTPRDPYLDYSIALRNYLQEKTIRQVYYRLTAFPGGPFEFIVGPPDLPSFQGYLPLKPRLIFGLIKPSLTGGKRIGYVFYQSVIFLDEFNAILLPSFNPPDNPTLSLARLFATFMHYLVTDLAIEDLVVDIRGNIGGFITLSYYIAATVGDTRPYNSVAIPFAGDPEKKILSQTQVPYVDPEELERVLPGSVFRGTCQRTAKVILITDINSASGGDLIPLGFIGAKGDGYLGANTQAYILGNIDGRLDGSVFTPLFPPINQVTPALTLELGGALIPVPPYSYEQDTSGSLYDPVTKTYSGYFNPATRPDLLIPHDFSLVYRDIGLLKPTIPYLDSIEPVYQNRETWKDIYLENALRILLCLPVIVPFPVKYLQVGGTGSEINTTFQEPNNGTPAFKIICEWPPVCGCAQTCPCSQKGDKCKEKSKCLECKNIVICNPPNVAPVGSQGDPSGDPLSQKLATICAECPGLSLKQIREAFDKGLKTASSVI